MNLFKRKSDERFGKLIEEQNNVDFLFYNGKPTTIATWKWVVAWLGTFLGFLALSFYPAYNNVESIILRILFMGMPLVLFAYLTKPYWKTISQRISGILSRHL